jgi:ribonuclease HI
MTQVTIYTDGACSGNPGPGGYGALLQSGRHCKELSAGYRRTTNNRMELMAVIAALRVLNRTCQIVLYSDSRYVVDAIEKGWAHNWRSRGWIKADKQRAQNSDLWAEALELLARHQVRLVWVKGHADNEGNNRCDQLAVAAAQGSSLLVDAGFEAVKSHPPSLLGL